MLPISLHYWFWLRVLPILSFCFSLVRWFNYTFDLYEVREQPTSTQSNSLSFINSSVVGCSQLPIIACMLKQNCELFSDCIFNAQSSYYRTKRKATVSPWFCRAQWSLIFDISLLISYCELLTVFRFFKSTVESTN